MKTRSSIIISSYKAYDDLRRCLRAFSRQTVMADEVIVADDGSDFSVAIDLLSGFRDKFNAVYHVWHEDRGHTKAKIVNRAIIESSGEVLLFTDADCLPERHFVEDHIALCQDGIFVSGSRAHVIEEERKDFDTNRCTVLKYCALKKIHNRRAAIRSRLLDALLNKGKSGWTLGCNLSCRRSDAVNVNGFDEKFIGWGHEDTDFALRLSRSGLQSKWVQNRCVLYHLNHPKRKASHPNNERLKRSRASGRLRCKHGLAEARNRKPRHLCTEIR